MRKNRQAAEKVLEAALKQSGMPSDTTLSLPTPPPMDTKVGEDTSSSMEVVGGEDADLDDVSFGEGMPANFTGKYELMGIVTHKGRSADSGHYIGWVRQAPGSSMWWKFDDEEVTEVDSSEIMNLRGGGDWHTAYLNFYRYKV